MGARLIASVLQYATQLIVARLLVPADFGLVAMVAVFSGVAGLFTDLGLSSALVQRPELTKDETDGAFGTLLIVGVLATMGIYLCAPHMSAYYHEDSVTRVARVTSLMFIPSTVAVVPRALLLRRLAGRALGLIDIGSSTLGSVTMIILALLRFGVWALVISPLLATVVATTATWLVSGYQPTRIRISAARPLASMSIYIVGFTLINYWARNLDNLLVGKRMGAEDLGLYNRAYILMMLPLQQITGPLGAILTAGLSSVQTDLRRAAGIFLRALGSLTAVTFPLMLGLSACASPFVSVVFGPKWVGVVPLLRVLAIVGALQSATNPVGWVYISQGQSKLMFRWGLFGCTILILGIVIGASFGTAIAIATGYLVATVVLVAPALYFPGHLLGLTLFDIGRRLLPQAISALAMFVLVLALEHTLSGRSSVVRLFSEVLSGALFYFVVMKVIGASTLADLFTALRSLKTSRPAGEAKGT